MGAPLFRNKNFGLPVDALVSAVEPESLKRRALWLVERFRASAGAADPGGVRAPHLNLTLHANPKTSCSLF